MQGWGERPVFGKIRYMNYKVTLVAQTAKQSTAKQMLVYEQGCQRKFNVKQFVERYPPAAANAAQHGISPY
jgi:hypothetical protein